jgi:thioredoxin 1
VVEQLATEYIGKVKIVGLDAHENYDTTSNYGVMGIPTLIFFKDGKEIARNVGAAKKDKLVDEIKKHFGV